MPFPDVTGKMSLQAMQIEHFTFSSWQSTWDVHSVITGLLKLLGKYNPSSLLSQPEIDQVLLVGKAPGRWMSDRHFGNHNEYSGPLDIPFICGPWCIDGMHFVVFFLCQNYWTILDPATESPDTQPCMQDFLKEALSEAYLSKKLLLPEIPCFQPFPRLAVQQDHPYKPWSCGTFAMLTTLHIILGQKRPDQIPGKSISRKNMLNFHASLLVWVLHGKPPDIWMIDCLNTSIVDCPPIKIKYQNYTGGPLHAASLKCFKKKKRPQVTLSLLTCKYFISLNLVHFTFF